MYYKMYTPVVHIKSDMQSKYSMFILTHKYLGILYVGDYKIWEAYRHSLLTMQWILLSTIASR